MNKGLMMFLVVVMLCASALAQTVGAQIDESVKEPKIEHIGWDNPLPDHGEMIGPGTYFSLPRFFWYTNPMKKTGPTVGSQVDSTRDANAWDFEPAAPNLFRNFIGPTVGGWFPPDPVVTVGPDRIIAATNGKISLYNKNGTLLQSTDPTSLFNINDFFFDPRLAYDPWRNRFLILYMRKNDSPRLSHFTIAISKTSTPTLNASDWWRYSMNANHDDHWADYGYIGFDQFAVYLTSYQIPHGLGFTDGQIFALNKDQIYNGLSASRWRVTDLTETHIAAAHMWSSAGNFMYFTAMHNSGSNRKYFFTMNWNSGSTWEQKWANGPSFNTHSVIVPSYDVQPNGRQPNSFPRLDTIDCRAMHLTYYNGILYSVHGLEIDGRAGFRAYRTAVNGTSFSVTGRDDFGASGFDYFYPSISHTNDGDAILVFGRSSENEFAQVRMTGWKAGQADMEPSFLIKSGSASYRRLDGSNRNRWGDYFGAALDPWDRKTVWVIGEYATGETSWSTWIAELNYKPTVHFLIGTIEAQLGQTLDIPVTLRRDDNLQPIVNERVDMRLNNTFIGFQFTDSNGVARFPHTVPVNTVLLDQNIEASFAPTFGLNGEVAFGILRITKAEVAFDIPTVFASAGQTVTLTGTMRRATDNALLPNRTVEFRVNNVSIGTRVTDANGSASINYTVPSGTPGNIPVTMHFSGDSQHRAGVGTGNLYRKDNVNLTLDIDPNSAERGDTVSIGVILRAAHNNMAIPFASVDILVNNALVRTLRTDFLGRAQMSYSVPTSSPCGQNSVRATYSGSNLYNPRSVVAFLTVRSNGMGDINRDRIVNDEDLLLVLFAFGNRGGPEDLNRDGIVDDQDLLIVIFNFGCVSNR